MAVKNFIVAIELGSTKIRGIAGMKKTDGSIQINAVVSEDATQSIRKGVIYNSDKTVQCITNVIQRLKSSLRMGVKQVFVGVGGQSVHSDINTIERDLEDGIPVSQDLIDNMMDCNDRTEYPEMKILDVETQEYRADSLLQNEPVGIQCSHLEANFLNILQSQRHYKRLNSCFENAGIKVADFCIAPVALADAVLSPIEKRSGCVLVDLGADTTTVMVYYKNILRHIAVIPLGANNITKDICSRQIEESDAEAMKLKYASAYTETADIDTSKEYEIDSSRKMNSKTFIDIVEARVQEIIINVNCQIPKSFSDKLIGGVILTGGGSNLKNIEEAFRKHMTIEKVRIAKSVNITVVSNAPDMIAQDGTMNTLIGLLAMGDQNCCMQEEKPVKGMDMFGNDPVTGKSVNRDDTAAAAENPAPQEAGPAEPKEPEGNATDKDPKGTAEKGDEKEEEPKGKTRSKGIGSKIIEFLGGMMTPDE